MAKINNFPLSEKSSVLFATFSMWASGKRLPTNGSIEPLRDYLVPKIKKLVIIDELHPGSDGVIPIIEEYRDHSFTYITHRPALIVRLMRPILAQTNQNATQITFKVRDFLTVLFWSLQDKTVYDYLIGLESINALAGIILRRLGKVKCVVYYVSDYSPSRYPNKLFNSIYLALDRFCATHADYIWDVSKAMQPARLEVGLDLERSAPAIHVPNGLLQGQILVNPIAKLKKYSLVYMGTLGSENGPDIAIEALSHIIKKIPTATLHIVGGTEMDAVWLKDIVKKYKVEQSVVFHGFIPDSIQMSKIIRSCALGLAPYKDIPGSIRKYADAGKIRAYCASGLPTISSYVPPLGLEVAGKGAAILSKDDPKSFSKAILSVFSDTRLYRRLRGNAILFAKNSTWENTFSNAFKSMHKK